jgi:hypothetical protein
MKLKQQISARFPVKFKRTQHTHSRIVVVSSIRPRFTTKIAAGGVVKLWSAQGLRLDTSTICTVHEFVSNSHALTLSHPALSRTS